MPLEALGLRSRWACWAASGSPCLCGSGPMDSSGDGEMDRRATLLGLILFGFALAAPPASGAGPTYVEGSVEGVWTLEGSPYVLVGNATVQAGKALVIGPGGEVRGERETGLEVPGRPA